MILQLGIPGQLAAVKTTVNNLIDSGTITGHPCANFKNVNNELSGIPASASITSTSYVDAVSVSGRGILYLAALTVTGASSTSVGLQIELDGTLLTEITNTMSEGVVFAIGIGSYNALLSNPPYPSSVAPIPVPYRTGFKLKAKRVSGTSIVAVRYHYLPFAAAV